MFVPAWISNSSCPLILISMCSQSVHPTSTKADCRLLFVKKSNRRQKVPITLLHCLSLLLSKIVLWFSKTLNVAVYNVFNSIQPASDHQSSLDHLYYAALSGGTSRHALCFKFSDWHSRRGEGVSKPCTQLTLSLEFCCCFSYQNRLWLWDFNRFHFF